MRILGIDPGSVTTGFGIIEIAGRARTVPQCLHYGAIKTGGGEIPQRLKVIFEGVGALIQEYRPDQMAVENVFVSRGALSALKLGQARGAAICAGVTVGLPVAEYAPRQIKQAVVGRGGADKVQVQHMVGVLLRLPNKLQADAADALAVALCHQHYHETKSRMAKAIGQ